MIETIILTILALALLIAGVALLLAAIATDGGEMVAPIAGAVTAIAAAISRLRRRRSKDKGKAKRLPTDTGLMLVFIGLLCASVAGCGASPQVRKEALVKWGRCMTVALMTCSAPLMRTEPKPTKD
jgi:O-antigen/teichoic acid export membrane protein